MAALHPPSLQLQINAAIIQTRDQASLLHFPSPDSRLGLHDGSVTSSEHYDVLELLSKQ